MPTITKIAQQKRKKDRYSIYLDDQYSFSVEEDVLIRRQLTKGQSLTEQEIKEITEHDTYHRSYLMAVHYLSYRMRSIEEMNAYLQKKEIDPVWIEQIIVALMENKLLDDDAFAEAYVRDRMHQTSKGPRMIEKELKEKGISNQIAQKAIRQYDASAQFEKAAKWYKKECQKKSRHAFKKRQEQLRVKLLQKGFDADIVQQIFSEIETEADMSREQELFFKQADKLLRKYQKKWTGFDLMMKMKQALYQRGFTSEMIEPYIDKLDEEST